MVCQAIHLICQPDMTSRRCTIPKAAIATKETREHRQQEKLASPQLLGPKASQDSETQHNVLHCYGCIFVTASPNSSSHEATDFYQILIQYNPAKPDARLESSKGD